MRISIIIPCFNAENYIARCIESVLNQTYADFELLLIDDGSFDKTRKVCEFYLKKDSRIAYHYQSNKGVSAARNFGIRKATGSKIMFIDADDYVDQNIVNSLVNVIDKRDNLVIPICGMCHVKQGIESKNSNYQMLLKNGRYNLNADERLTLFEFENLSSPCCKLYDREILKKNNIKFNEAITYQEDLIFNLDYFKFVKNIVLVPSFDYYYIENETSSSLKYHENLFASLPI
ncbi:glycosyltransferase family 2 protein, partial [Flavobacterium sp. 9AF]|uniref:glycosyltransferase family 2 protein n=1 Tax=Flavobacterium sp. 9AF TaxID=2653142 RepID=UPI00135951C1